MLKAFIKSIDIFEYDNYRKYLKDLYFSLKSNGGKFSFRYFSRLAGFRSPNFLKLVMEGERNISPESIDKFAKALKLNKPEAAFFRNLVLLNQAQTVEEKKFYAEQLLASRFYKKAHPLKQEQYEYYSKWYLVPIRELVATEGFREDPEWIGHRLNPPISSAEAKKAIEMLLRLGFVQRDSNGKLVQTAEFVSTGDEVSSLSVAQFHKEMIAKGAEAIDRIPSSEREISSVTLGLSEQGATQVKELIQRFRKELLALASQDSRLQAVHQVNFQFFPLTRKTEEVHS